MQRHSYSTTPVFGVIDVFVIVSDSGSRRSAALRLGYTSGYFDRMEKDGVISPGGLKRLMKEISKRWPEAAPKPFYLQRWERDNPQLTGGKPSAKQESVRKCLACNTEFLSEGPHNRLCDRHRNQAGGYAGYADHSTRVW